MVWASKSHPDWATCEIKVFNEGKGEMKIILQASAYDARKASFSLFYRGEPIKRLCINGNHRNRIKDKRVFTRETHKHIWIKDHKLSWAYAPDDITTDDPEHAFDQFCSECHIENKVIWNPFPTKLGRFL